MDPELFAAVSDGIEAELNNITNQLTAGETRRLLQQRVMPEGDGLLHVAARFGRHNLVQALFNKAAQVMPVEQPWWQADFWRATNSSGQTCLHEAIRYGRTEFVQQLLTKDDSLLLHDNRRRLPLPLVQVEDDEGMSPLYLATTLQKLDIIAILIHAERVHPASYTGPQGRTAMHAAVVTNSIGICQQLLGWNNPERDLIRRADGSGSTPLHYLASSRNSGAITPLHYLASWRNSGAIITPLHYLLAFSRNSGAITPLLLVAANIPDKKGSKPIHIAAGQGRLDIVKLLLRECPDSMRSRDSSGQTFLHVAAQKESTNVVAHICKQDGRKFTTILNARDQSGNTALHLAVLNGDESTFLQLIRKREVDLNIANRDGHTPLDLLFLSGKVAHDILRMEGYFVPRLAISNGQVMIKYLKNRYDWMAEDLIVAGASRGAVRLDHFATQLPQIQDMDKEWDKLGKNANALAVCAGLILNAAIALPFNVAPRYNDQLHNDQLRNDQKHTRQRALAFKGFLASDAVAFLSSAVATFCFVNSGFAPISSMGNLRVSSFYFGASCVVAASLAIVGAFALGMYAAFTKGLYIFPTVTALLVIVAMPVVFALVLGRTCTHNAALIGRLGMRDYIYSLVWGNRRMPFLFLRRHVLTFAFQFVLYTYCFIVAGYMF